MNDISLELQHTVLAAVETSASLQIEGGGSKGFYGREPVGMPLAVGGHRGIVDYAATELVITGRAGTPLQEIEGALAQEGQMLAFEPPRFGSGATLGGAVAAGFSGPRRPFAGALRDFMLGAKILDGNGEILAFGGQVMKNVAGYDVSRLVAGSLGTLGVILEVSLKVLPKPERETTVCFDMGFADAVVAMNRWAGSSLPLSALCCDGERVYVRLAGAERAVAAARKRLGGEALDDHEHFWRQVNDQTLPFFGPDRPLWRLSLSPAAPDLPLSGAWLYDWCGAQRWLISDEPAERVFSAAIQMGGHATLFRGGDRDGQRFQPLPPEVMALQRNLKKAFDPAGVFNRGRLYGEW